MTISLKDIKEVIDRIHEEDRDGAIKRETNLGNGVKRIQWIKGCKIVDTELIVPSDDFK